MTAEQLLVLGLLAAAFAAGWVARGGGGSSADADRGALADIITEAGTAVDRAMTAYRVARSMAETPADDAGRTAAAQALEAFGTAARALERTCARLGDTLGPSHPLSDDCSQVVDALSLLGDELAAATVGQPLDVVAIGPVEAAAREARARYHRGASAVLSLSSRH